MKRKIWTVLTLTAALSVVTGMGVYTFAENQSTTQGEPANGTEEALNGAFNYAIPTIKPVPGPTITPITPTPTVNPISPVPTNTPVTPTITPTLTPTIKPAPTTSPAPTDAPDDINTELDTELDSIIPMFRLYNPNSGEHFYTANVVEKDSLAEIGWNYEGIGWYATAGQYRTTTPVYRLYNKAGGEHHYTINRYERNSLIKLGWKDEGVGWYSYEYSDSSNPSEANRGPGKDSVPLYRQYNPHAFANNHNYTMSMQAFRK